MRVHQIPLPINKAGVVYKRGGSSTTWKRRWFVLDGSELKYYKNKTDTVPAGMVRVADMTAVTEGNDPTKEARGAPPPPAPQTRQRES